MPTDRVQEGWTPGQPAKVIKVPEGFDAVAQLEKIDKDFLEELHQIKGKEFERAVDLMCNGTPEEAYVAWGLFYCWCGMLASSR